MLVAGTSTAQNANAPASMNVLVEQVLSLFPKVDGDVLEVAGDVVTLSAGRREGVVPGIELSVYREGRELRHPRTGAMLGRTEQAVGRVVIEQVQEAYSTGRLTTPGADVRAGDRARVSAGKIKLTLVPFVEGVKDGLASAAVQELAEGLNRTGRFQIAAGDAVAVALLQEGLSRQEILEGKGLANVARRFNLDNVLFVHLKMVQRKPYMDLRLVVLPGATTLMTSGLFVPPSVKAAAEGDFSASGRAQRNQTARPQQSLLARLLTGELDSGAYSTGEGSIPLKEIAKFPFVVQGLDTAVAPADKVVRMVITDGQKVYLYRIVDRALEPEWTWTGDGSGSVFGVQLADLDGDGVLEVVVNRYHPNPGILVKSLILGTKGGRPEVLVKDINQILLAVDPTGEGVKRTLWGQDFVQNGFWKKGQVDRLVLKDGRLVTEAKVAVPGSFRATGATFSNIGGKSATRTLAFVDEHNRLRVATESEELWRSSSPVGQGTTKVIVESTIEKGGRNYVYLTEPNPLAIDLDGDGIEEIVVPQNQVPGRLAVIFKGPAGYRFQSLNSGFEGTITGLGAIPSDSTPSLLVAVTRFYGVLTNAGDTQIIMTIPE